MARLSVALILIVTRLAEVADPEVLSFETSGASRGAQEVPHAGRSQSP